MTAAKSIIEAKKFLEQKGHQVKTSGSIEEYLHPDHEINEARNKAVPAEKRCEIIKDFFEKIKDAEAYLVINLEKHGKKGYIGASVLMELGVAFLLSKKIYLLNRNDEFPEELDAIKARALEGDLGNI